MEETQSVNTYPDLATKDEAGISVMALLTARTAVEVEKATKEHEWESEAAVVMVADMEKEEEVVSQKKNLATSVEIQDDAKPPFILVWQRYEGST